MFHGIGGWELLAVVRAGLVVVALGLLLAAMVELGVQVRIAAILVLVAFLLAAPALALRPQLFAIAIFCAFLWMVTTRWWHPTLYLFMPVLVVLWANVHGSFVLVPLILGFALLDDIACSRGWRRSAIELVVGTAATLINPFGIGVWTYAANIGIDPVIRDMVSEWQHTSPLTVPGLLFYASLAGTLAFMVVRSRHKGQVLVSDWLWVGGFAFIAVWAERGLAWWPFAAAYTVATLIGRIPAPREQRQRATHEPAERRRSRPGSGSSSSSRCRGGGRRTRSPGGRGCSRTRRRGSPRHSRRPRRRVPACSRSRRGPRGSSGPSPTRATSSTRGSSCSRRPCSPTTT